MYSKVANTIWWHWLIEIQNCKKERNRQYRSAFIGTVFPNVHLHFIKECLTYIDMMYIHGESGSGRYPQFPDHIHTRVLRAIRAGGPSTLNPRVTIAHNWWSHSIGHLEEVICVRHMEVNHVFLPSCLHLASLSGCPPSLRLKLVLRGPGSNFWTSVSIGMISIARHAFSRSASKDESVVSRTLNRRKEDLKARDRVCTGLASFCQAWFKTWYGRNRFLPGFATKIYIKILVMFVWKHTLE